MQLLAPISSRWDLSGGQLGVDSNVIEGLKVSTKPHLTKLTDVLQKWIDIKPTPLLIYLLDRKFPIFSLAKWSSRLNSIQATSVIKLHKIRL